MRPFPLPPPQHIKLKKIPVLELSPERFLRKLTAGDAASSECITFNRVERVGDIVDVLGSTGHNGFPVVERDPGGGSSNLLGIVLRTRLLVVLKKKVSFMASKDDLPPALSAYKYDIAEFAKPISSSFIKLEDIQLTHEVSYQRNRNTRPLLRPLLRPPHQPPNLPTPPPSLGPIRWIECVLTRALPLLASPA